MRELVLAAVLAGCHGAGGGHGAPIDGALDAAPDAAVDHWKAIFDEVDGGHLTELVKEMAGVTPVTVDGMTFTIDERYSATGRARFLSYWRQYMTGLGLTVQTITVPPGPRSGTDLEAVLPGASPDSFVVIVHYDSIGPPGAETSNPGADDDMTGMAIELETARILVAHRAELGHTVRFVASDEEELGGLAGARAYASYVQAAAHAGGFAVVAAVDDEQSGWDCHASSQCHDALWPAFDVFTCSADTARTYDFPALLAQLTAITGAYSPLRVNPGCVGPASDHYAMWEIGVPALVFGEHDGFYNPHFDQEGGDTFATLDPAYLVEIARPAITFEASLAGIAR